MFSKKTKESLKKILKEDRDVTVTVPVVISMDDYHDIDLINEVLKALNRNLVAKEAYHRDMYWAVIFEKGHAPKISDIDQLIPDDIY